MTTTLKDILTYDRPFTIVSFDERWARLALDVYLCLKVKGLTSPLLETILGTLQTRLDLKEVLVSDGSTHHRWYRDLGAAAEIPKFDISPDFNIITTERFEGLTFSAVCSIGLNNILSQYITAIYYKELYFNETTSGLRPVEVHFANFEVKIDLMSSNAFGIYVNRELERADASKMVILNDYVLGLSAKSILAKLMKKYPENKTLKDCAAYYSLREVDKKKCFPGHNLDIESFIVLGLVDLTSAYVLMSAVDHRRYQNRMRTGDETFVFYKGPEKLTLTLDENGNGVLI